MRLNNLDYLGFPASGFDFGNSSLAEFVGLNGQGFVQIAVTENLDTVVNPIYKTVLAKSLNINHATGLENLLEITEIDKGVYLLVQRFKTALGQTALQRHLTAFEAGFDSAATAGILTLMALPGGFAIAGTGAASDALTILCRADSRPQITQIHI
jgi:hypothetical protein